MSLPKLLCAFSITVMVVAAHAQDLASISPENLSPLQQGPLKLLATTALSGKGQDYFTLKPKSTAVIGTVTGPAVILRVWSTSSKSAMTSLEVTIDGKKRTLYEKGKPVGISATDPLQAMDKQAFWSYVPLAVKQKAVFTARSSEPVEDLKFYLQVGYRAVSAGDLQQVTPELGASLRGALAPDKVRFAPVGAPTKSMLRLGEAVTVPGPARYRLKVSLPAGTTIEQLQATRLILTCDGSKTVDVLLGAMFAQYWQLADYHSAATGVRGQDLLLHLPIPVAQTLRVELGRHGRGGLRAVEIALVTEKTPAPPTYHLCAQYFSLVSVKDQPLKLLNATGPGLYVGSNLAVDGVDRKTFAFLEGNEQLYVDGATTPTIEGTGTEDYFNNSWYFEAGQLARPFHGVTFIQPKDPPRVVAYRWMLPDCLPFKTSLRFDLQHGSRNGAPNVLYKGVMFWYQQGPVNVPEPIEAKLSAEAAGTGGSPASSAGGMTPGVIGGGVAVILVVVIAIVLRRRRRA